MKKIYEYSHLGGSEILQVRYPKVNEEINKVVENVVASKTKISKEKTMSGDKLYNPTEMNKSFKKLFEQNGFKEMRLYHEISIPYNQEKIKSYKQIDFTKDKVLVEVQLGKYAFMFYDMAKFQYFFNESAADVGVEIVPCYNLQKQMSTGVSYGEQLIYDIERLKRHFPAVPVKIILIDGM